MPKVNLLPEVPFVEMQRLIKGYGLNSVSLGKVLNVSPKTAKCKLDEPSRLTLGDIDLIHRRGHIPMERLREAVKR